MKLMYVAIYLPQSAHYEKIVIPKSINESVAVKGSMIR